MPPPRNLCNDNLAPPPGMLAPVTPRKHARVTLHWSEVKKSNRKSLWSEVDYSDSDSELLKNAQIDIEKFEELFVVDPEVEKKKLQEAKEKKKQEVNSNAIPLVQLLDSNRSRMIGITISKFEVVKFS